MLDHAQAFFGHTLTKAIGAGWAVANFVTFGWNLLNAIGPILIGIGAVWSAYNTHRARLDRQRAEAKEKA
jgi:hypothetical protein